MNKSTKLLALLLALVVFIGATPLAVFADAASSGDEIVIIAGSDFQDPDDGKDTTAPASSANVTTILSQIKKNHPTADGLIFCGDYDKDLPAGNVLNSTNALKAVVNSAYPDLDDFFLVQGNHDQCAQGTNGLSGTGAHDTADYGVYLIDEDDYQWSSGVDETKIIIAAADLADYLDEKVSEGYTKPIFIASHVPLHFTPRTQEGDGKYGYYIFSAVQKAAAAGLQIIYLYGHDHSQGWDNYMGGAAVYLPVGHDINICNNYSTGKTYATYQLNFTYMNAGFTGYYADWEPDTDAQNTDSGVDKSITMTCFVIKDGKVTVERYDENGLHNLKSEGKENVKHTTRTACPLMTDVLTSPQYILLPGGGSDTDADTETPTEAESAEPAEEMTDEDTGINICCSGADHFSVYPINVAESLLSDYHVTRYVAYDFSVPGFHTGTEATVGIPVPAGWNTACTYAFYINGDTLERLPTYVEDGIAYFTTTHFSGYLLGEDEGGAMEWVTIPGEKTVSSALTSLSNGDKVLIRSVYANTHYLTGSTASNKMTLVSASSTANAAVDANIWTVEIDGSNYYLKNNQGQYLTISSSGATVTAERTALNMTVNTSNNRWTVTQNTYTYGTGTQLGGTATVSNYTGGSYYYNNNGEYLQITGLNRSGSGSSRVWTITYSTAGGTATMTVTSRYLTVYQRSTTTAGYLAHTSGTSTLTATGSTSTSSYYTYNYWTLYKVTERVGGYAAFTPAAISFPVGKYSNTTQIEALIRNTITVYAATLSDGSDKVETDNYTLSAGSAIDPAVATPNTGVDYTVTYEGINLGRVNVVIYDKLAVSLAVSPMESAVYRKSAPSTKTGSTVTVTYDDGTTDTVDLTVGMLSGDDNFDIRVANEGDEYYTVSVNYLGLTVDGYKLTVLPLPNEVDYPEYPNEGSVRVDKSGTGIDFQSSGLAVIELSATGVPMKKGVDIIVMVDTSSSMKYGAQDGTATAATGSQRIDFLRSSLKNMVNELQTTNEDGTARDTRIAIADFNGYTYLGVDKAASSAPLYPNYFCERTSRTTIEPPNARENKAVLFTGPNAGIQVKGNESILNADAFIDIENVTDALIDSITVQGGTNFDYAFDTVYKLGEAIQTKNAEEGVERDLVVVFMSDGCSFQYNGAASPSQCEYWNDYVSGTWTMDEWMSFFENSGTHTFADTSRDADSYDSVAYFANPYFYNGKDNPHRTAQAIKGSVNDTFNIINFDANSYDNDGHQYMETVYGLGATLYSVGFCIYTDTDIQQSTILHNIEGLASVKDGESLYYRVDSAEELDAAFVDIATSVKIAGTKAYFIDKMGDDYDLRLADETYTVRNTQTQTIETKTFKSSIRVLEYQLYKTSDIGTTVNGHLVTAADVGVRYGTPKVLETVTFNADGTEAYSSLGARLSDGNDSILLGNGLIFATNFIYNTTDHDVTFDFDMNYLTPAVTIPAESFYWWIGDIDENEIVLEYNVYLTGSMEGTCPAGSYPTNESAILYYTNWLDHPAHLETVPPVLPWQEAVVNFGFYLVDANGTPVVNQSSGLTGSFTNRVIVVNKTQVAETINLNNGTGVSGVIEASNYLPRGYTLYDPDAAYQVSVNSNGGGGWDITVGEGKNLTTYVADFGATPTTQVTADDYNFNYDYSHTTVWFAVLFELKCVPDTVVIDYGKSVDIQALINDRFGSYGTLAAIGEHTDVVPTSNTERRDFYPSFFGKTVTLDFGTATLNNDGTVTYTISGMKMTDAETFAYAVRYNDPDNASNPNNGYYFADITVVPASIIYYEESFVQLNGTWTRVTDGTVLAEQAEDRPGAAADNPAGADADNIYGYDAGYAANGKSSDGVSYVTTVTAGMTAWPTATFTFTGTGFDIISATDKLQGFVLVEVYDEAGELVCYETYDEYYGTYEAPASWGVDCYYGFKDVVQVGWIKFMCRYTDGWHSETEVVTEKSLKAGEVEVSKLPATGEVGKVYVMYEPAYDWTESDTSVTLYQIPIVKSRDALTYGTYTVVITPMYSVYFDHVKDDDSYNFVIDAIRIYDPAGVHEIASAEGNVNTYYLEDNEAWPQFIELRDVILGKDAFSVDETVDGAVFVDAYGTYNTISDYNNFGPNNEVYLAPGQSVAFRLNADAAAVAAVHMATKCVNGDVTFTVNGKTITTVSSTDLYYDITDLIEWDDSVSSVVVISNTGDSIQSVTNLKITFTEMPDIAVKLQTAKSDVQDVLDMIEAYTLGTSVELDEASLFHWMNGQQLTVGTACLRKAPQYTPNSKFAVTGIIPYIAGETDVINLAKYDNYTAARLLWVNEDGIVIGVTSTFKAGVDVNINSLGMNGTKVGAVGYILNVELARTAAQGPAAYAVVSAGSVISGYVETEAPTEAPTEPETVPASDDTTFNWVYGKQYTVGTSAMRKAPETVDNAKFAISGVVPFTPGQACVVNLGQYDAYTGARVLWVDANGNVVAFSRTFKAGTDTDINALGFNGSKNNAVGFVLTVELAQTVAKAPAAFTVVSTESVLK